jgi:hypothetical protein
MILRRPFYIFERPSSQAGGATAKTQNPPRRHWRHGDTERDWGKSKVKVKIKIKTSPQRPLRKRRGTEKKNQKQHLTTKDTKKTQEERQQAIGNRPQQKVIGNR